MIRKLISALLAGALCMATVVPAGAVNSGGTAAVQEEAPPEALTEIGRAHVNSSHTSKSRMPSSA